MQRLMCRLYAPGRNPRRHRLDALALARQEQPGAISLQRRLSSAWPSADDKAWTPVNRDSLAVPPCVMRSIANSLV